MGFLVALRGGVLCALKVVTGTAGVEKLNGEHGAIAHMHGKQIQLPLVVLTDHDVINVPNIWQSDSVVFPAAAYLMSSVGTPAPCSTPEHRLAILKSLSKFHQASFIHGDPRIADIIMIDNDLKWIDVMGSGLIL